MVIKGSSKTKDRGQGAGAGNAGNRTVTCLDDTLGIITDSFCSTILIAIQNNTFTVKTSFPTVCYNWGYSISAEEREA